jgi:hypothetical protein
MDLFYFWNQNLAFTAAQTSIPCNRITGCRDGKMMMSTVKQEKIGFSWLGKCILASFPDSPKRYRRFDRISVTEAEIIVSAFRYLLLSPSLLSSLNRMASADYPVYLTVIYSLQSWKESSHL